MINRHVKAFFLLSVTLILLVGVATISAADTDGNSTVSDVSTQTDVPTQADVSTSTVVDEVDSDNNYENVNTEELNEKDAPSNKLQANSNPSGTYKVQITGMEMKSGKLVLNSTVTKNNIPISGGRVSYSVGNKWVGSPGPRYGNATLTTNNPGAGTYTIKATYIDVFDVQQANTTASLTINTTDVVINSYTFSNGNLTIKTKVTSYGVALTSGRVSYTIDNKWKGSPGVSNGIASLTIPNPGKGTHKINVTYINANGANVKSSVENLVINGTQVKFDSIKVNSSKLVIKAEVTNLGQAVTNGRVVFNVNAGQQGNITVKNGIATTTINRPKSGTWTINATYYNANNQLVTKVSTKYQINDTKIYINSVRDNGTNVTIVGTVIDNGNICHTSGKDEYPQRASIFIDKKWIGSPGLGGNMFVLTRASPAGGYHNVSATYVNGSNVEVCTDTLTFYNTPQSTKTTISTKTLYKGIKNNITAKVTSTYGVNSGRVSFTLNDKWIGSVGVTNGAATLAYDVPLNLTAYTLLAKFIPEGETYIGSNTTVVGYTSSAPTKMVLVGPTVLYGGEKATYNATVKFGNAVVTTGSINFYVDGKLVSTQSVKNGVAYYTYTMPTTKNHTMSAVYSSTVYGSSNDTLLINLGKYETMTVAEPSDSNVYAGNKVTLTAYVLLAETYSNKNVTSGKVSFVMPNETKNVTVSNGVASCTYTVPANMASSLLTITVKYLGDNSYTPSTDTIYINVLPKK